MSRKAASIHPPSESMYSRKLTEYIFGTIVTLCRHRGVNGVSSSPNHAPCYTP